MFKSRIVCLAGISMTAAAFLSGCNTLGDTPSRSTNLTGSWKLDESRSPDPLAEKQASRGGHGDREGGGRGRRGGGPRMLSDFTSRPAALTIKQTSSELALNADGATTTFVYGEKVMASVEGGASERRSGFRGNSFVVRYKVFDGPTATRSYTTTTHGAQLIVATHVSGGYLPTLDYQTVYERAPAK
jgi:hypothetical protein